MTLKERADQMVEIQDQLEIICGSHQEVVQFINHYDTGIHLYRGLRDLAKELNIRVKTEKLVGYEYNKKIWIRYRGVKFFELECDECTDKRK